jgi:hypothetical protein
MAYRRSKTSRNTANKRALSVHELYAVLEPRIRRKSPPPTKAQMRAAVARDIARRWSLKRVEPQS